MKGDIEMNLSEVLQEAIRRAEARSNKSEPFDLKNLFIDDEWKNLEAKEKRQVGAMFAKEQKEGRIPSIIRVEDGKNRQNMYKKV